MSNEKDARRGVREAVREERARDAAGAMRDYEKDQIALRAKTARLRAARLAREETARRDEES
jgi:hypothetical protein